LVPEILLVFCIIFASFYVGGAGAREERGKPKKGSFPHMKILVEYIYYRALQKLEG
jgi:hypothetical protein